MLNYFNYFTEIEDRFSQRKGSLHLLSTLDWALIEIWKDAGIPLTAVLLGIDAAFDHWEKRPARAKIRKINSLAFCVQEVLAAAQEMASAAVGAPSSKPERETGFEAARVGKYVRDHARELAAATVPSGARRVIAQSALRLEEIGEQVAAGAFTNEEAERHLTALEQKIQGAVLAATSDAELVEVRREAEREMAPYKRKMQAAQIAQLQQQYVHKRLLERCGIPRLSLFYLY